METLRQLLHRPPADPNQLFLCCSPWPMVIIASAYLLFVLKLGRLCMASRVPFDLRGVLRAYNLMQILYNGLLFLMATFYLFYLSPHKLSCLRVLPGDHPMKSLERRLSYAYYVNKYIDLLDTIFIVLRKNYKQITILHLLHHLYMPISGYFIIRFVGFAGHIIVTGVLNLFIHISMYTYYYFAARHPQLKRNLWWKQYITILQMLQFILIFAHSCWTLGQRDCDVPREIIYMVLIMSALMLSMFINFFVCAYMKPKQNLVKEKFKED